MRHPRGRASSPVANIALPDIGKEFDSVQTTLDLIAVGYSLGLASSVIYLGALGDRYGSKLTLVLGVSLSVPACLLAAYAPSDTVLVGARALLTEYHTHDTEAAEVARRSPASHLATRLSPRSGDDPDSGLTGHSGSVLIDLAGRVAHGRDVPGLPEG